MTNKIIKEIKERMKTLRRGMERVFNTAERKF